MKKILILLFSISILNCSAGNKVDSLRSVLKTQGEDTNRVRSLMSLASLLAHQDQKGSLTLSREALLLAQKLNDNYGCGSSNYQIGKYMQSQSNYDSAFYFYDQAIAQYEKGNHKTEIARIYYSQGIIFATRGKAAEAQKLFLQAQHIYVETGNKHEEVNSIIALSIVMGQLGQFDKKISYLKEALEIKRAENDSEGIASCLINMGNARIEKQEFKEGIVNFTEAEKYISEDNPTYLRNVYGNLGSSYKEIGDFTNATKYILKSKTLSEKLGDKDGLIIVYNELGDLYVMHKEFAKAHGCFILANQLAIELKNDFQLQVNYEYQAKLNYKEGDYKKAYENFERSSEIKGKLQTKEQTDQVNALNAQYESDKKDKEIKIKNLEAGQKDIQISDQKKFSFYISIGLILALALVFFIFRSYRQKKQANLLLETQKKEIAHQKELVDEKNTEILDSIHYAQKIQRAILPSLEEAERSLGESFILFMPKDIVSGDFYWIAQKEEYTFYVAADCTGHGVPGGFMSMLGTALLNEVVNEKKIVEPADILDMLRVKIILALKQKGLSGENKDGMDMCLVRLNKNRNELVYAAANNSLYIVRDKIITDHKGDKQPVGISGVEIKQFAQHKIDIQKGDCIYTFTDGYADQFGGPKGKKFKYKQLEELLTENSALTFSEQKNILEKKLLDWKGSFEQVDDICVIGVRI